MRLLLPLLLAACGPEVSYRDEVFPLLQDHCTRCHGVRDPDAGLDLYSTGPAGMIDVASRQSPLPLVTAGDHLNSYLFHKINGTQTLAQGSGTQMPIGSTLTDAEIELIAQWIDDGAPW